MKNAFILFVAQLFFVASSLSTTNDYPDDYFSITIDSESGLSRNKVNAIFQSSDGFLWLGTSSQLNRYDGVVVKTFDCYDPATKKGDKSIVALAEDDQGKLWVGTGSGVFIYDPVKNEFRCFDQATATGVRLQTWVSDIHSDKDHNVWITAPCQGVFRFHTQLRELYYYDLSKGCLPNLDFAAQCVCVEENGTVWAATRGEGLFLYHHVADSFVCYTGESGISALKGDCIFKMCEYGKYLAIGIHDGQVKTINKYTRELEDSYVSTLRFDVVREVKSFNGVDLWIGTETGLYLVNEKNRTTIHIEQDLMNKKSLPDNKISCLCQDKEGGVWVGTFFGGACCLPDKSVKFEKYIPLSKRKSITGKRIKEIREDASGNIWIATEDAGIDVFNPQTRAFQTIEELTGNKLKSNNITGLYVDKENVWVGFFQPGLDVLQLSRNELSHYSGLQTHTNEESVYSFYRDSKDRVWLGTLWSLYVAPEGRMPFKEIEALRGNFVHDILEDKEGWIWMATLGQGICRYHPQTGKVDRFCEGDSSGLLSNAVCSITEDSRGRLWFATDGGGICVYDRTKSRFISFTTKEGLPDNTACKILEDDDRRLWFGTTKGLVRFNPERKEIKVFTTNDGLPGNQFTYKSALKSGSGEFYFGGADGLIRFHPCQINENDYVPPVFITKMTTLNKKPSLALSDFPAEQAIEYTKSITLRYDQSSIGFDFASLSFTAPLANKYAYKMENVDADWISATGARSAFYNKLPPGKYVFKVKGSNNDGVWNEQGASVEITILPPWWETKLAYVLYVIVLGGLAFFAVRSREMKSKKKAQERARLLEAEKERELYRAKIDFFTYVAHEIRTPLTLINGPLESILELETKDERVRKNLDVMKQNTDHLLRLINQSLDFRRVESNRFQLDYSTENINELLIHSTSRFSPLFERQKKRVELRLPEEPVFATIDREAFNKIINNLLSNAIRYSEQRIIVELRLLNADFEVSVLSDGELIPVALQEKIFEPFFRLSKDAVSGSGIGLSISSSLAELLKGSLCANVRDALNVFVLKLPLVQEGIIVSPESEAMRFDRPEEEETENDMGNHDRTLLLVEDNIDMLSFIAEKFQAFFSVEKAENGLQAMEILSERPIDLIVSDIMMGEMDGLELCKTVKNSLEYSHISVVLLTAKNDLNSKMQGLEAGADAYVEKPFSFAYLLKQVHTLLDNRLRERKAFAQNPLLSMQRIGMNKTDNLFLSQLIELIYDNLRDDGLNVEKLADVLAMSRSNLHRKVKIVTGLSPVDFLRLVRLRKAAELILSGKYRLGDICLMVGIQSQSYFSKLFKDQFGITPKEFKKQASGNKKM